MYAILDIETTGGKYNEEGITEIAIFQYDGHKITDQFCSLVNPERPIQPFVVNLTGINNDMLRQAPKFYEVAKRIIEITENCILVAHNAQFDNRILTTEFDRLGYTFEKETLCTVELAKQLLPDMESYSLGKLVRALGIPISDRHRAQGDAKATVALFKLLLQKDKAKKIISQTVRKDQKNPITPKLKDIIAAAPSNTGVFYMHDSQGNVIYIGKSRNIKKRLTQHFTNDNRKSKRIQNEVASVSYEETGNDLIAQLKELDESKYNKPKYNAAVKSIFEYQLSQFKDENGYINLKIEKADKRKSAVTTFTNLVQAKNTLNRITEEFGLCQKLTGMHNTVKGCLLYKSGACQGACIGLETAENYNKKITAFLENTSYLNQNMFIIDRGRSIDERSVILIENGIFLGFGYFNLNYQLNKPEILRSIITPMKSSRDAQYLIHTYLRKSKSYKLITFPKIVAD